MITFKTIKIEGFALRSVNIFLVVFGFLFGMLLPTLMKS